MFERRTPRIFAQGTSPATKLMMYGTLCVLLLVVDGRFQLTAPVRQAVGTATYPLQWLMLQPVLGVGHLSRYAHDLDQAQTRADAAERKALQLAEQVNHVHYLERENESLRGLLELSGRVTTSGLSAEVSYEAPDPFTNRLVLNKGQLAGVRQGTPVLDSYGVLGQITQVYPLYSEVRVVTDREQSVPVMNLRTGLRMVAFGESAARAGTGLELRFVPAGSDVQEGDVLVTSGIDGYYPPGLPVATVDFVETHSDAPFTRILAQPVAQVQSARYVMLLEPVGLQGDAGPVLPAEPAGGEQASAVGEAVPGNGAEAAQPAATDADGTASEAAP